MKKLLEHDKLKHFFFGSLFTYFLMWLNIDALLIFILCLGLGALKEFYDHLTGGTVEGLDMVYTAAASIVLYFIN